MKRAARKSVLGAACLALPFLMIACTGEQTPVEGSLAAPGVLRCAEVSVYGVVEAVDNSGPSSSVQFGTKRWVIPESGDSSVSFDIDPVDESWDVGDVGLLVLKDGAPPLLLNSSQASEVEESWDGVNKPDSEDCSAA